MPPTEAAILVARYLRFNHYTETLKSFVIEAGLPEDAGDIGPDKLTIEKVLDEKHQFDVSLTFEKKGDERSEGWSLPAPESPFEPQFDNNANILCVKGDPTSDVLLVSSADRALKLLSAADGFRVKCSRTTSSPILSLHSADGSHVVSTSMSGHLAILNETDLLSIDECRNHSKYAVQAALYQLGEVWVIATAGWDRRINVYCVSRSVLLDSGSTIDSVEFTKVLNEPCHTILLLSNPESIVFVEHPDTQIPHLVTSRRDSTHLYYYKIEQLVDNKMSFAVKEAGRQNLAPHSNAWIAFTPCSLVPCPTDPTLLAVATSHLPHMKVILVRLLFPDNQQGDSTSPEPQTQASVARAELALQDRENAAIRLHVNTLAPQTPYSTPHVVWRPDGSGLFVNGDDGVIRGLETTTGKVITLLKGHEFGSKVRTLWSGKLALRKNDHPQEVLISGGFDKKLLVWTCSDSAKSSES